MHIFSLQACFSYYSASSKLNEAISVMHLIASILEVAGTKKLLRINGMRSVSKM